MIQVATVVSCWRVEASGKHRCSAVVPGLGDKRILLRAPMPLEPGARVCIAPRHDSVEWFLAPEAVTSAGRQPADS